MQWGLSSVCPLCSMSHHHTHLSGLLCRSGSMTGWKDLTLKPSYKKITLSFPRGLVLRSLPSHHPATVVSLSTITGWLLPEPKIEHEAVGKGGGGGCLGRGRAMHSPQHATRVLCSPPKPQPLLPTLQTKAATSKTWLLPSSDKPW